VVPSPISKFGNYHSLLHTVTTTTPTLNDTTSSPPFDHTPGGSPASCQQPVYSRQHLGSLNRGRSESNKRSMAAQGPLHGPLSNATTKARHPRRRHSLDSVLPSPSSASDSADRRPSTTGSTASSGWESQVDTLAELFEGKMTVTSTQGGRTSLRSSSILLNYSPSHTVISASATSLNDPTHHPHFHRTPGGSPSSRHQSLYAGALNRHLSEPNIRSIAAHPPPHYPSSNVAEVRHQRQQRRPQHCHSFQHVIPSPDSASISAERGPGTAGSAASSGWESRGESLQGMTAVTPTQGAHASLGINLCQSF